MYPLLTICNYVPNSSADNVGNKGSNLTYCILNAVFVLLPLYRPLTFICGKKLFFCKCPICIF